MSQGKKKIRLFSFFASAIKEINKLEWNPLSPPLGFDRKTWVIVELLECSRLQLNGIKIWKYLVCNFSVFSCDTFSDFQNSPCRGCALVCEREGADWVKEQSNFMMMMIKKGKISTLVNIFTTFPILIYLINFFAIARIVLLSFLDSVCNYKNLFLTEHSGFFCLGWNNCKRCRSFFIRKT